MDKISDSSNKYLNRSKKILLIVAGTFFIGIGIIGIFIPILPTTPFILIAASLYARSSQKLYKWIINNKVFGRYIKNYREGKGIPLIIKISAIALLWITIGCSALFAVEILFIRIIMVLIALGVTVHIACIKTFNQ
ncbi:MAG: YbaN family protein [Actinobacteria bacterium]|nr:YbaN family protein [Actinomycetota bacterium]MCG2789633.1 YbaN family protein [Actinomycetes bacterium]